MMLIEQTTVPDTALPLAEFKAHLRMGTGFADGDLQDEVLESFLRAAISAIEARVSKAVLTRSFRYTLSAWRDLAAQVLPLAPVSAITALIITDMAGEDDLIDPARYRLVEDTHRPKLVSTGLVLSAIPVGGSAAIEFEAGFGAAWDEVPRDLAQAVMLLAAHFYDHRGGSAEAEIPLAVIALLAPFRTVRLFGGGA